MKIRRYFLNTKGVIGVLLLLFATPPSLIAANLEARLKAAYLFRLSLFVEWPKTSLSTNKESINFCIAENQSFHNLLFETVATKTINDKSVKISLIDLTSDLSQCHILFLSKSTSNINKYFSLITDKPVLTIGESKEFYVNNGMIVFFEKDNRLRFSINEAMVKKASLVIRAQLLKLATEFRDE